MTMCDECGGTGEGVCANCEDHADDCCCEEPDVQDCATCGGTGKAEPTDSDLDTTDDGLDSLTFDDWVGNDPSYYGED